MLLFLLFITGLLAGTIDAIAGGGGLLSLPVLLGLGVPPHVAFGTNKFQGTVGTFMAARKYYQHGYISLKAISKGFISGLFGAAAGAIAVQFLSRDVLHVIVPILLSCILIYTILSPKLGKEDIKPRMEAATFYLTFGFLLAFYDGFFGPGTGSFWVFLLTFLLGFNLIKATAYAKIMNLNSSFIATICFALGSNIDYRFGICMAAGQIIGGRLGAYLAIKKGARLIRPMFLGIVTCTVSSLLIQRYANADAISHFAQQHQKFLLFAALSLSYGVFLLFRKRLRPGDNLQ